MTNPGGERSRTERVAGSDAAVSALNVIKQRDRVVVVTDGAVWDVRTGVIAGFPCKQATLPSHPAVLATRGARAIGMTQPEAMALVIRCARDSMPPLLWYSPQPCLLYQKSEQRVSFTRRRWRRHNRED
jgi:hypothetical protein